MGRRWPAIGRAGVLNLAVALAYFAVGTLALAVGQASGLAAPVWPSAGLALAVSLRWGWVAAPAVAVGSMLVNGTALLREGSSSALVAAAAIGIGAALQAQAGGWAVRRFDGPNPLLATGPQIIRFILLAGPVACVVSATMGVVVQLGGGVIAPDQAMITWITWWVGDTIGVVVFAPLVLMLLPGSDVAWRGRRLKVAIPSVLAIIVATVGFAQTARLSNEQVELRLEQRAVVAAGQLERNLQRHLDVLEGVRGFFTASKDVSREEFARYTAVPLGRLDGLQALSWNAAVKADELAEFERDEQAAGFTDFRVFERAPDGTAVGVSGRDDYVPVTFIEPLASNAAAIGFDIQSNAVRAEAIARARDTGEAAATAPVTLVQESGEQQGVLVLLPLYEGDVTPATVEGRREAIRGYAVGVYRLGDLLAETFDEQVWSASGFRLVDVTDGAPELLSSLAPAPGAGSELMPSDQADVPIAAGGRTWVLQVTPTRALHDSFEQPTAPALLIGGLAVAGLLEALLLLITGTERRARRRADASDFEATHDALTGLLNRRGFDDRLHVAIRETAQDGVEHALLFLDLDDFKTVNDTSGHPAGDALLRGIGEVLRAGLRHGDVVARFGGDEFVVLLTHCPESRAETIAANLNARIRDYTLEWEGRTHAVSASIGMVPITHTASAADLVRAADTACYLAKRSGKDTRAVAMEPS